MSKITNDGLTRFGIGCFIAVTTKTVGVKGFKNTRTTRISLQDFFSGVEGYNPSPHFIFPSATMPTRCYSFTTMHSVRSSNSISKTDRALFTLLITWLRKTCINEGVQRYCAINLTGTTLDPITIQHVLKWNSFAMTDCYAIQASTEWCALKTGLNAVFLFVIVKQTTKRRQIRNYLKSLVY